MRSLVISCTGMLLASSPRVCQTSIAQRTGSRKALAARRRDMTLILSNDDVEKLLTMPDCIAVMEEAYVELAEGRGVTRTRSDCMTPTSRPDAVYGLKS